MEDSLCPGNGKSIPDSHKHRSQVRHLSQTEVGSVEKEDRRSSRAGRGAIGRGPREFSETEAQL